MIDFTNCNVIKGKAFGGANGSKIPIQYDGEKYMLKFPPPGQDQKTALSYTNNCISEYLGCHVFQSIGIETQKTILGTYNANGKTKIVCACKDFTASGERFYDFSSVKNTIIDSEHEGNGTELESISEAIAKQNFVDPQILTERFWDLFVVDALIGNFDRHNGNWGFLVDAQGGVSLAPVFDCGSSLLSRADENVMKTMMQNEAELDVRIYRYPASAIKMNGHKLNYHDFLTSGINNECNHALTRIVPKIDLGKIAEIINDTSYITDTQKEFYNLYIRSRYEKILVPALEIAEKNATMNELEASVLRNDEEEWEL